MTERGFSFDPAIPYVVRLQNVSSSAATVTWSQTVPGRDSATPIRAHVMRRGQDPLTVPLRWQDEVTTLRFGASFVGAPRDSLGLHLAVVPASSPPGHVTTGCVPAQVVEIVGTLNDEGVAQASVELSSDRGRVEWSEPHAEPATRAVELDEAMRRGEVTDEFVAEAHRAAAASRLATERAARKVAEWHQKRDAEAAQLQAAEERRARGEPDPTLSLLEAAAQLDPATVRWLLAKGADVSERGHEGRTALHLAAWVGPEGAVRCAQQLEAVHLLLTAGADVNARDASGSTPLHFALRRVHRWGEVHAELVQALLAAGSDPEMRNEEGYRPEDRRPEDAFLLGPYGATWEEVSAHRAQAVGIMNRLLAEARARSV